MNSATVVAITHDGEFVCERCLQGHAEQSVFHDWPDAQECQEADGCLSVAFADQVDPGDVCGRCLEYLLGCEPDEPCEPEEGDLVTEDHRHVYQDRKLVLTIDENADFATEIRAYMEREQYWPNVWWISDHGNYHLITL